MVLITLLVGAVGIWIGFTRLLRDAWPWQLGGLETTTPGFQLMQLVLTLIGGIGAAILVVVAYRRQRDLETARFDDRFAAAAAQLGADTAAERLAGVYAMAALADTWEQHRQQCIDVLCGYLRLPYDPAEGLLAEVVKERTWPVGEADKHGRGETQKETRTYRSLPNDREVRHTIVRVITEHLRDTAPIPWQGCDFDFTGAVFDGGNFYEAVFSGGLVSFSGAVFAGGRVSFGGAQISGGAMTFGGAKFAGGEVSFRGAKVSDGGLFFDEAEFATGEVTFDRAVLSGGWVSFESVKFAGATVSFERVEFAGGLLSFDDAEFAGGELTFGGAKFFEGSVTFDGAEFSNGTVSVGGADSDGGCNHHGGARVLMAPYDSDMPGWPTKDGELFFGWPPPEASGDLGSVGEASVGDGSGLAGS